MTKTVTLDVGAYFDDLAHLGVEKQLRAAKGVLEAVAKMLFALDLRRHSHHWRWAFATGILDLVLAVFIFAGWPSTAA